MCQAPGSNPSTVKKQKTKEKLEKDITSKTSEKEDKIKRFYKFNKKDSIKKKKQYIQPHKTLTTLTGIVD